MTTMMPPTVAGGNVVSRLSNRISKRSRTPSQMFKRENRITNNPMIYVGGGTGTTVQNQHNNSGSGASGSGLQQPQQQFQVYTQNGDQILNPGGREIITGENGETMAG